MGWPRSELSGCSRMKDEGVRKRSKVKSREKRQGGKLTREVERRKRFVEAGGKKAG